MAKVFVIGRMGLTPKSQNRAKKLTSALINTKRECTLAPSHSSLEPYHARFEFGGPWGVLAIMTGFPILMYYLWICLWFYDGQFVHPTSVDDIQPFLQRMWDHVRVVRVFNLFYIGQSSIINRMPTLIFMLGKFIPAIYSSSYFLPKLCPASSRKASQFLR